MLQRILPLTAGDMQALPDRVFAPQRATLLKSPVGLLLFSRPRRMSWGRLRIFPRTPLLPYLVPRLHARSNHGLPTVRYVNMLNHHGLFSASLDPLQGQASVLTDLHQARRGVHEPRGLNRW